MQKSHRFRKRLKVFGQFGKTWSFVAVDVSPTLGVGERFDGGSAVVVTHIAQTVGVITEHFTDKRLQIEFGRPQNVACAYWVIGSPRSHHSSGLREGMVVAVVAPVARCQCDSVVNNA